MAYRQRRQFRRKGTWAIRSNYTKLDNHVLYSSRLSSNAKIAWAICFSSLSALESDSSSGKPVLSQFNAAWLEKYLNVSKRTAARVIEELKEAKLIIETDVYTYMLDPREALKNLEATEAQIENDAIQLAIYMQGDSDKPELPEKKPVPSRRDTLDQDMNSLKEAWNKHKPHNYAKIVKCNEVILSCVNTHLKKNGIEKKDYNTFFQLLCKGIFGSDFWYKENNSKSLISIVGGTEKPQPQKISNVVTLISLGRLRLEDVTDEQDQQVNRVIVPSSLRPTVNLYHELHHAVYEAALYKRELSDHAKFSIEQTENNLIQAGYDPSLFRQNSSLSWPTDVTPSSTQCTIVYDDDPEFK